jgi:FO synthase subunit 2
MDRPSAAELDADDLGFRHRPETDQSFENALAKARDGRRLTVDDAVELLTTGTETDGLDPERTEAVLTAADHRRREEVGEEVTFVANLNNNVTTACNTGCLFCNFKDTASAFEADSDVDHPGFTKTPAESREIVRDAVARGIYEVCSVSGLHPAFALDAEHHEILQGYDHPAREVNYKPPAVYDTDPGTYTEQIAAMAVDGVHVHSITPEEAYHARRGTEWSYREVYDRLVDAGLDSAPGTAAEILVDEVRDVICPGKIDTEGWLQATEAAVDAGLDVTATIMYGHVERPRTDAVVRTGCGLRRRDRPRGQAVDRRLPVVPRQRREHPDLVGEVRRREGVRDAVVWRKRLHGDDPLRRDHQTSRRPVRGVPVV